ncbi:Uncharacterised protein [Mycobacteroides abscessus subsp. abscessus]|nr:Uncharacterised protein [Mycobacteroides abscessus subsp. abscessus]SIN28450.1 Uncharacterised protein [Mycobacteroides abscessus subsp. abscessus]
MQHRRDIRGGEAAALGVGGADPNVVEGRRVVSLMFTVVT